MKVVVTDHGFKDVEQERTLATAAGADFVVAQCHTEAEVVELAHEADALLVQYAPITPVVIDALQQARVIVRYGIGFDNIDVAAAARKGIAVCNVPDYGVEEVADHAVALALALARQLPSLDARLRQGTWSYLPDNLMPALSTATFATAGFGRIARAVLDRARPFVHRLAAYDPFVPPEAMQTAGVMPLSLDGLFAEADILSLHLPLTPETHHFAGEARLKSMKPTAIVINTARGPLVDTIALARLLEQDTIAGAGFDVYEDEPVSTDHPLFDEQLRHKVILTSHIAWYSESSLARLQRLAGEEVVRALQGQPLRCPVAM